MIDKNGNAIPLECQWTLSDLEKGNIYAGRSSFAFRLPDTVFLQPRDNRKPQQKNLGSERKCLGSGPDTGILKVLRKFRLFLSTSGVDLHRL